MDWLRINKNLPAHPKAKALARALGEPVSWWRIAQVWAWCIEYAPDGRIVGDGAAIDIEDAAGWTGERGFFISACVREKFLDRIEKGFVVHDWDEHNGAAIKKAQREIKRVRKWREQKKKNREHANANVTRNERVQNANVTGRRDETRRDETRRDETDQDQQPLSAIADGSDGPVQVFRHWQQVTGHQRTAFDSNRRTKVEARLRDGYTVAQLKRAVDGCKLSPHHQGQNERRLIYDDLELICRDAKHVDQFIAIADRPPPSRAAKPNGVQPYSQEDDAEWSRWAAEKGLKPGDKLPL